MTGHEWVFLYSRATNSNDCDLERKCTFSTRLMRGEFSLIILRIKVPFICRRKLDIL